jgi:hypothetical protein
LNEFPSKFESNEKSLLIHTSDDIGTISDSLEVSNNGKSDDWCDAKNSLNELSTKSNDDKKSMRTVKHAHIAISSEKESSFENEERNHDTVDGGRN